MHGSARAFVERQVRQLDIAALATLEVGSLDVNGGVRDLFTGDYLGVDMRPGPGVDAVMNAEALHFDDGEWATVVSTEVMEHCDRPWRMLSEMTRVTAPGGHVLLTVRGFDERGAFALHDHPADHWRLGPGALEILAGDAGLAIVECIADPECPGWFLAARKPAD
jgi:SAM-dependent methyltransferase